MVEDNHNIVLQWVGDIGLNEELCSPQYHESIREGMAKLADEAGPCDLRIGNLESPLWGDGGVNQLKRPRICTTEQAAKCILPLGLDLLFVGNNHIYDCLERGFENTTAFLQNNNIRFLGAGKSQREAAQPVILEKRGISLGFLNYVHRNTNPNVPSEAGVFLNYFDEAVALEEIACLSRKVDVLLLYLHWGAEQFIRFPTLAQRRFGRQAVETGATVVCFDHAHTLQPHEEWRDGHIFYGLGILMFGHVPTEDWPDLPFRTAIANIEVSPKRVRGVRLDYRYRKDIIPVRDNRKSRLRSQKRLNCCIRLPDRVYAIIYEWEKFYQLQIVACFKFIEKSGGIIPALLRIRTRHFSKLMRAVTIAFRRTQP